MIKQHLAKDYNLNKLHNAYLISCDDIDQALLEVLAFLNVNFYENDDALSHSDFMIVKKMEGNVKNISVDQIRSLQKFLNKTSVISGKKAAIILEADKMNLNAFNSCLKLLEDTPKNTYIFLISSNSASILPTIRSRCAKIRQNFHNLSIKPIDDYYIKPFLRSTKMDEHLGYLRDFSKKDRDLWTQFTINAHELFSKVVKIFSGLKLELSSMETEFCNQLSNFSLEQIIQKYDKVVKMTEDTINFDLDLKASYLILIKV